MIDHMIDPNVIKICEVFCKKKMRSAIEIIKKRGIIEDVNNINNRETSTKSIYYVKKPVL